MQKIKTEFLIFEYYVFISMLVGCLIFLIVSPFVERTYAIFQGVYPLLLLSLGSVFRSNFAWTKEITLADDYLQVETPIMQLKIRLEDVKINLLKRDQQRNAHLRIRFPGRVERRWIMLEWLDFRAIVPAVEFERVEQWAKEKGVNFEFGD